jgi:predicted nucleic acid-binding protein
MVKALFDTCILIDYLNKIAEAKAEIELYDDKAISAITWMEVMVGTNDSTEGITRQWLKSNFSIIDVSEKVGEHAVAYRKETRIKLPDAIIYATAICTNRLLVTRNTKDFKPGDPVVRIPYERKLKPE